MLKAERGIALIAVLGFLAAMSLIAMAVVGASRSSITGAQRHLARVQAQAAVDAGINFAIAELVAARTRQPSVLEGEQIYEVGAARARVLARPESAKIDLNFADVALLMGMFRAAGADADKASALAAAVLDWRDADDLLHVNGAEAREYEAAGRRYGPANKSFESVDELRLVLGVSESVFACLRGEVTIFSQRAEIDSDGASPFVRRAAGLDGDGAVRTQAGPSVISGQTVGAGEVFEITARVVDVPRGIRRAERVVVRITGNPREPYWILASEPADLSSTNTADGCSGDVVSRR